MIDRLNLARAKATRALSYSARQFKSAFHWLCSPLFEGSILLLNKFCSLKHFASQHSLLPGSLCSLEHSAPWNTLTSTISLPWHTLLLSKLCFMKHFASCNTLLPVTVCCLEHFAPKLNTDVLMFKGVDCVEKQSALRECSREQRLPGSKLFQAVNRSRD